jgi:hypothetical protein
VDRLQIGLQTSAVVVVVVVVVGGAPSREHAPGQLEALFAEGLLLGEPF